MKQKLLTSLFAVALLLVATPAFAATMSIYSDTSVEIVGVYNKATSTSTYIDLSSSPLNAVLAAEPTNYPTAYAVGALNSVWDNGTGNYFTGTGAEWIWETERAEDPENYSGDKIDLYDADASRYGRVVVFEKEFVINGIPQDSNLRITADNGWEVLVNGVFIARSNTTVAGWETSNLFQAFLTTNGWQTVGNITIPAANLANGTNTIKILAGNEYYFTDDNNSPVPAYIASPYRQQNPGALIFKADINYIPVVPLEISKTVTTSFDRDWDWSIEKTLPLEEDNELTLAPGQSYIVGYLVELEAESTDSNWEVSGKIIIHNPNTVAADITNITDSLGAVTCPDDFADLAGALAAGATIECTYSGTLPDGDATVNVATVTTTGDIQGKSTLEIPVTFGDPTTETDECATVDDTYDGLGAPDAEEVCADEIVKNFVFSYSRTIETLENATCDTDYPVENIASFVTNDSSAHGSDDLTITVVVPCIGCTLTQGYWKTHSDKGPAPYDDTWAQIGEGKVFFKSNQSYYNVLWTPPKGGNAYYQLAHQYIAAELNMLNGASVPANVQASFVQATALFGAYTPAEVGALKGSAKQQWTSLAGILGSYNEGKTGPGHCDEQNPELVETITVNSANMNGANSISLISGKNYLFEVTGTWNNRGWEWVDAKYTTGDNWSTWFDAPDGGYPNELLDLQVNSTFVDWGVYSSTHTYTRNFVGTGATVNFRVFDGNVGSNTPNAGWYGDNIGNLTVKVYEL